MNYTFSYLLGSNEYDINLSQNELRFLLLTNNVKIDISIRKTNNHRSLRLFMQSLKNENIWYTADVIGEKSSFDFICKFAGEINVSFLPTNAPIVNDFNFLNLLGKDNFEDEDGNILNIGERKKFVETYIGKKYKIKIS